MRIKGENIFASLDRDGDSFCSSGVSVLECKTCYYDARFDSRCRLLYLVDESA